MDRREGAAARRFLGYLQRHQSPERYVDTMWLARTREEGHANIRRHAWWLGHKVWKQTIRPFFEKWLGVQCEQ